MKKISSLRHLKPYYFILLFFLVLISDVFGQEFNSVKLKLFGGTVSMDHWDEGYFAGFGFVLEGDSTNFILIPTFSYWYSTRESEYWGEDHVFHPETNEQINLSVAIDYAYLVIKSDLDFYFGGGVNYNNITTKYFELSYLPFERHKEESKKHRYGVNILAGFIYNFESVSTLIEGRYIIAPYFFPFQLLAGVTIQL